MLAALLDAKHVFLNELKQCLFSKIDELIPFEAHEWCVRVLPGMLLQLVLMISTAGWSEKAPLHSHSWMVRAVYCCM